jgi:very-short-patch-repair endonuclease
MTAIYLAGKIGPHDWREHIVPGIQDAWGDAYHSQHWSESDDEWPVLPNGAIGQFDYTGPYFVGICSHSDAGCSQGEHRAGSECEGDYGNRSITLQRCLKAIDQADIIFAWLYDLTAFGTLAEIGYAKGRGKIVIVASPEKPGTVNDFYEDAVDGINRHALSMHDLWFAFTLADMVIKAATPLEALKQFADLNPKLESPIEEAFWRAYLDARPPALEGLKAQHEALGGQYRLDFALPDAKIGIELDGYAYHSTPEAFTRDRRRERDLELAGWRIIRFSGSEVNRDADDCIRQAAELADVFWRNSAP